jgi:hypothetical protein
MFQVQTGTSNTEEFDRGPAASPVISPAERELRRFIHSARDLFDGELVTVLTELWLEELACMDCIPERESIEWRVVTLRAAAKLANKLLEL